MPTLSLYEFTDEFMTGPFTGENRNILATRSETIGSRERGKSLQTWFRVDTEKILNMAALLANPLVTSQVQKVVTPPTTLNLPLQAQAALWSQIPDKMKKDWGTRVKATDAIVRVYFDVHIPGQSGCLAVTPTLSYYIVFRLENRALRGTVEGNWYEIPGWMGEPCSGAIGDRLAQALVKGIPTVQNLVNEAIQLEAPGQFTQLYLLPGSGTTKGGGFVEDASKNVAIVLVP